MKTKFTKKTSSNGAIWEINLNSAMKIAEKIDRFRNHEFNPMETWVHENVTPQARNLVCVLGLEHEVRVSKNGDEYFWIPKDSKTYGVVKRLTNVKPGSWQAAELLWVKTFIELQSKKEVEWGILPYLKKHNMTGINCLESEKAKEIDPEKVEIPYNCPVGPNLSQSILAGIAKSKGLKKVSFITIKLVYEYVRMLMEIDGAEDYFKYLEGKKEEVTRNESDAVTERTNEVANEGSKVEESET